MTDRDSAELLPCPFCGSAVRGPENYGDQPGRGEGSGFARFVECVNSDCHANIYRWRPTREEADAALLLAWNTRAAAPSATAPTDEALREIAEAEVLRVRGSHDAPGFEACVKAELQNVRRIACEVMRRVSLSAPREEVLEEAAQIALNGCLVPPDGGSPTDAERELCEEIASRIRALKTGTKPNADV